MKTKLSPLTKLAIAAIEDLKGIDVRLLDVRAQTPMTDAMLVCTGTSNRHVRSIAENVIKQAKDRGHAARGVEGLTTSEWVLVDLGEVLVHVMQAQTRAFYQLEKLWDVPPPKPVRPEKPAKPAKPARRAKAAKPKAPRKAAPRKLRKK